MTSVLEQRFSAIGVTLLPGRSFRVVCPETGNQYRCRDEQEIENLLEMLEAALEAAGELSDDDVRKGVLHDTLLDWAYETPAVHYFEVGNG